MPRINPYTRLHKEFVEFVNAVFRRNRVGMWRYPKDKLSEKWTLRDL